MDGDRRKTMKQCSKCKELKPESDFYKNTAKPCGLTVWCSDCLKEKSLEYYYKNKDKRQGKEYKERHRRAFAKYRNSEKGRIAKRKRLLSQYKMTIEEYNELLSEQKGNCSVCGEVLKGAGQVDHDHITGDVRGILCGKCNRLLGLANDNVDILASAISYLINGKIKLVG